MRSSAARLPGCTALCNTALYVGGCMADINDSQSQMPRQWSPPCMSFFFTLLDDSLRPRGSRDPLGIEQLWSGIGRKLVGNLTTVTGNLDNFIVTLLGFHLCQNGRTGETDWPSFERFEQLTGHARLRLGGKDGVLGSRRINKSRTFPIALGSGDDARILENPRQAGLWGLYSTALVAAGLTNGQRRPTPRGEEIASMFLSATSGDVWRIALNKQRVQIDADEMTEAEAWVKALLSAYQGRRALVDQLLSANHDAKAWHGEVFLQANAFLASGEKPAGNPRAARDFLMWMRTNSSLLGNYASRVLDFDEMLVLSAVTFNWLLGCHGRSEEEVVEHLEGLRHWPFRNPIVPDFSNEIRDRQWRARAGDLSVFCLAMARGAWREAIAALFDHHAEVVKARGGAPWCYVEDGLIKVVMNGAPGVLPAADDLAVDAFPGWMRKQANSYFLEAFLSVLKQVNGSRQGDAA